MLLNLSNHPSEKWSDQQRDIALKAFGNIEDIAFPNVDPETGLEGVQQLAKSFFEVIQKKAEKEKVTVHLMGEMTFTYTLVKMLELAGITCVASTTKRIATEKEGKKVTIFEFKGFRPYF